MKAYYAARADYYDAVYEQPERHADIAYLQTHLPERLCGCEVLEIACGTGFWTRFIAPVCERYTATDDVAEPLEVARQRLSELKVQTRIADAYELPSSLGFFNAAFAGLWLSHVPRERLPDFLVKLHARLLPGSRVVLIDNTAIQCKTYPIVATDDWGNTYQDRPLRDGSTHRILKNFPSAKTLQEMANACSATRRCYHALEHFWYFEYELPEA